MIIKNINEKITLIEVIEDNFNYRNYLSKVFSQEKLERPKFVLINKLLESKLLWSKMIQSGQKFCSECSRRGTNIFHYNDTSYKKFKSDNRKHLKDLDYLNQFL